MKKRNIVIVVISIIAIFIAYRYFAFYKTYSYVNNINDRVSIINSPFLRKASATFPPNLSEYMPNQKEIDINYEFISIDTNNTWNKNPKPKNEIVAEEKKVLKELETENNIEKFKIKFLPEILTKVGNLKLDKPLEYKELSKLPIGFKSIESNKIFKYWILVSNYFIYSGEYNNALLMAYAPIPAIIDLENKYCRGHFIIDRLLYHTAKKESFNQCIKVIKNSRPDSVLVKKVIRDLFTLLDNDIPLSYNINIERSNIKYILKELAEIGDFGAKEIYYNSYIMAEFDKVYDNIIKLLNTPDDLFMKEIEAWVKEYDGELSKMHNVSFFVFTPLVDYSGGLLKIFLGMSVPYAKNIKISHTEYLNRLKKAIRELANYAYRIELGQEPENSEVLEKFFGHSFNF